MSYKVKLIYVYDPVCSWCFGFHNIMEKIAARFGDRLNIEVKVGGLATGERVKTIVEGYSYVGDILNQVEETTGVEFGRNFKLLFEEGSYLYDSLPPCRAQVVVNKIAPQKALSFAGALQHALFVDGKNLNQWITYKEIANNHGLNATEFKNKFDDPWSTKEAESHFEWCKRVGATGFPTLLLKIGDEYGIMARGYRPFDPIDSHLNHFLNNIEKMSQ